MNCIWELYSLAIDYMRAESQMHCCSTYHGYKKSPHPVKMTGFCVKKKKKEVKFCQNHFTFLVKLHPRNLVTNQPQIKYSCSYRIFFLVTFQLEKSYRISLLKNIRRELQRTPCTMVKHGGGRINALELPFFSWNLSFN